MADEEIRSGQQEQAESEIDPLIWDTKRLRIATDAAGVGLWSWNVDTDAFMMDERSHRLWGVESGPVTFEDLSARIHPKDLDKVREVFTATRDILGAYEVDFRVLHDNDIRWVSARGMGHDQGIVGRIMFGVFLDMTERKQAEEEARLATEAKTQFLASMSHEIRSPLNGIIGYTEQLMDANLPPLQHRLARLIQTAGSMLLVRPAEEPSREVIWQLSFPFAHENQHTFHGLAVLLDQVHRSGWDSRVPGKVVRHDP